MRVLLYPEKKWEEFGAVRYEVEWHELTAKARDRYEKEGGDIDFDEDLVCRAAAFKTKDEAKKFAEKAAKKDNNFFGDATLTKQVVGWCVEEDRVAEWQNTSEVENVA